LKKYRLWLAWMLMSTLLLSGCQGFIQEPSFDQLLRRCAQSVENEYKKFGEYLTGVRGSDIIDFPALQKVNPELYAWLYIPGTDINWPIAQNESGDISYYQSHAADRTENPRGCLYTHFRYSDKSFNERVSVIYGKNSASTSYLDGIEMLYRSQDSLEEYQDVFVLTEQTVLQYRVFCASEFSDVLISREYNEFHTDQDISDFLNDVQGYHTMQRQTLKDVSVNPGDRLLVLTAKLLRNEDHRFIVVAKMVDLTN